MIYKNSRYTNTPLYSRDDTMVFKRRNMQNYDTKQSKVHVFIQGETLPMLAQRYYRDTQLWWAILEANPKYRCPLDIVYGDVLIIPPIEEVLRANE